jgi:hypothetical protein
MKNVNTILQQKIYDLLQPVLSVPIYYKYLPSVIQENAYVLITTITNVDASTMHTSDTDTTVQLGIYSRGSQANAGVTVNETADIIYETLYPDRQTTIDLSPDYQNTSISLVNDTTPDALQTGSFIFINRFITLRLNIFNK